MLKIYNTLTKRKEAFKPLEPGKVKIYVCGPTVYDASHIGHARSMVVFDVIFRYLQVTGYEVTYVRNFTDIDDKIINRAGELGITTEELAKKHIQEFYEEMDALKVKRATHEPKATEHIGEIIEVIRRLFEQGHAYQAGRDVYYAVESFKGYGKLSGRRLEDMQAGARVEIDENKRNPLDFVLWKGTKPGEPKWDSPWGKGRPGWHIECSAMSIHFLGRHIDMHGGGKDLIFPHHENEIAQSEGAFQEPVVNFWVHNGFVNINQEKMSKSLGNFVMIKEILRRYHPEAVRLFLLSSHYRSPVDYTEQAMAEAEAGLEKIYTLLERMDESVGTDAADLDKQASGDLWKQFCEAMNDDFNTARALGIVFDALRQINRVMDDWTEAGTGRDAAMLRSARADFRRLGEIIGIGTEVSSEFFARRRAKALEHEAIDEALVERLIAQRTEARHQKDWAKADQIRDELAALNIVLEDRPEGTIWKTKT